MTDTAPAASAPQPAGPEALPQQQPQRPKALSLRKNFSWTFAGNVVNASCQLIVVSLIAKIGSAEMLGTYSWALAIVMPIVTFAMFQFRVLIVTDVSDQHAFATYFKLRLLLMVFASVAAVLYAAVSGATNEAILILALVALSRSIDGINDLFRAYFQRYELMHLSGSSMAIRGIGAVLAVGLALVWTGSLAVALSTLCIVWLLLILSYDVPHHIRLARRLPDPKNTRRTLSWQDVTQIMLPALPMGIVMGLGTLQSSIPRLFLESIQGKAAVGYFSAILYPLASGMVVVSALGHAALPRLSRHYHDNRMAYKRLLLKLLAIALLLGNLVFAVALVFGRPLLSLVYTPDFASYQRELLVMCGSTVFIFLSSFLGYGLSAARKFYIQPVVAAAVCGTAVVACLLLVPKYGVMGASLGYAISAGVGFMVAVMCMAWTLLFDSQTVQPS